LCQTHGQGVVSRQASCRRKLAVSTGEFYIFVETVAGRRSRDESRADHEVAEAFALVPLVRVLHDQWIEQFEYLRVVDAALPGQVAALAAR